MGESDFHQRVRFPMDGPFGRRTRLNVSARATAFFANDSGLGRAALRLTASEAWINRVLA
jgi:hypothetical protein